MYARYLSCCVLWNWLKGRSLNWQVRTITSDTCLWLSLRFDLRHLPRQSSYADAFLCPVLGRIDDKEPSRDSPSINRTRPDAGTRYTCGVEEVHTPFAPRRLSFCGVTTSIFPPWTLKRRAAFNHSPPTVGCSAFRTFLWLPAVQRDALLQRGINGRNWRETEWLWSENICGKIWN